MQRQPGTLPLGEKEPEVCTSKLEWTIYMHICICVNMCVCVNGEKWIEHEGETGRGGQTDGKRGGYSKEEKTQRQRHTERVKMGREREGEEGREERRSTFGLSLCYIWGQEAGRRRVGATLSRINWGSVISNSGKAQPGAYPEPTFTNAQGKAKDKDVSQQPAPPWPQAHQIKMKRPVSWKIPASPDLRALYFSGRCWGVGGRRV